MNAALRTKLVAGLLLVGIAGGTIATVAATTAPEQETTNYAVRSGLYPSYNDALDTYLGDSDLVDAYGQFTVRDHGIRLCLDAERGASDSQIISATSQNLGGMGYETSRRLDAVVLAYGICSVD